MLSRVSYHIAPRVHIPNLFLRLVIGRQKPQKWFCFHFFSQELPSDSGGVQICFHHVFGMCDDLLLIHFGMYSPGVWHRGWQRGCLHFPYWVLGMLDTTFFLQKAKLTKIETTPKVTDFVLKLSKPQETRW